MNQGMQDDFKRDGFISQLMKRLSRLEAFEREFRLKRFNVNTPLWLPFGVYSGTAPWASNGVPYQVSLDRTVYFVQWTQATWVTAPNDAVNYWDINLFAEATATLLATVSTQGNAAATPVSESTTTFAAASVGVAEVSLYVQVVKVNAPGALYVGGPAVEVTV